MSNAQLAETSRPAPAKTALPVPAQTGAARPVADSAAAPQAVRDVLRSPGQPLDPAVRAKMNSSLGHDFSAVRVHTDMAAARSARAVKAVAYTVGQHIVFSAGEYQGANQRGLHLLAHELMHVRQQVRPPDPGVPLIIGASSDPAEAAANRSADSVFGLEHPAGEGNGITEGPVLRRFSEGEHRRIGEGAYSRAFAETQSGPSAPAVPAVDASLRTRLRELNFKPGTEAGLSYGQLVAAADEVASFELLEERQSRSTGTRIPLLSPVWDWLGDKTQYLDLAARNTAHFHPHNYMSWQPWHWQALHTMGSAWEVGEGANGLKAEVRAHLQRFDAASADVRRMLKEGSEKTLEPALNRMQALLGRAQQKQTQCQALRAQANDLAVRAMAMNGFGDHFLTDAFAAGHIVTPRQELLRDYTTEFLGFMPVGSVLNCVNIPSLAWHDLDNFFGVDVDNARGESWKTYGDDYADKDAAPGGRTLSPTLEHVTAATAESVRQMWQAAKGQQPSSLLPVLNHLPRPKLEEYPPWSPRDWDLQLRYAAGEQLAMSADPSASSSAQGNDLDPISSDKPPNPKGNQLGSGIASFRATCIDLISRFTYTNFFIPMIGRIRADYARRYFSGRPEQLVSPGTAPVPQASVSGHVVAGVLLGGVVGGVIGALGGLLLGGLIGGLFGRRRDTVRAGAEGGRS
ncbi:hypothetical protein QF031_000034 [Pseudarthrobacter defluvii]|uniref:eCIS core domain-containing protein n=1 Tax=Pseudarthrobacter defluvii TaxID=410837 RepID=UPI00278737EC|nr:DUF4157 domain-containing protein [Pseudarthrobacter defluvii]MDQ0767285.1 hypothetical protein [Pseudarthrobacter defluvii]